MANDPVVALRSILNIRRYRLLSYIAAHDGGCPLSELRRSFPDLPPTGVYRDAVALEHAGLIRPTGDMPRRPHVESSWELAADVPALLLDLSRGFPSR